MEKIDWKFWKFKKDKNDPNNIEKERLVLKDLDAQLKKHGSEELFEVKEVISNAEWLLNRIEKAEKLLSMDYENPEHEKLTHSRLLDITTELDVSYDRQRILSSIDILIIRYREVLKDEREFKSIMDRFPDTKVKINEIDSLIEEDKKILDGTRDIKEATEKIFDHLEEIVKLGRNNIKFLSGIVVINNSLEKRVEKMRKESGKMTLSISKAKQDITVLSGALNESVHKRKAIHDKVKFLDNELKRHILTTVNPEKKIHHKGNE